MNGCLPLLVGLSLPLGLGGCGPLRIRPPRVVGPAAVVYLADYGPHSALILPRSGGQFVEYGYGWWPWYALNHDRWYNVFPIFMCPGAGTLARRTLPVIQGAETLQAQFGLEHAYSIPAEPARVAALLERLDAGYDSRRAGEIFNPVTGMNCVPSDRLYAVIDNCNTAVADWLDALGCDLSGQTVNADFEVQAPAR